MLRKSLVVRLIGFGVIWLSVIGYPTLRVPAVIGEEEVPTLGNLGTIVVTATRLPEPLGDLPTNVSVVTKEEIARLNARNVGEAIRDCPSIDVSKIGTIGAESTVRIRGGGGVAKQTLVMIDGRAVNSISLGMANLSEIPVDNVERVEIVRGPSSALYGPNALGGVVNILTRRALEEKPITDVHISGGSFNTQIYCLNFGMKRDKIEGLLSASRNSSDGWRENSDYLNNNFTCRVGYDFGNVGNFIVDAGYYGDEMGVPGQNFTPLKEYDGEKERKAQSPEAHQRDRKGYGMLKYKNKIKAVELETKIYGGDNERIYEDPEASTHDLSKEDKRSGEIQLNLPLGITMGGDIHQERFRRTNWIDQQDEIKERILKGAVFLQKIFSIGQLTGTLGLRYDHHSVFGGQTNPRLALVYKPLRGLKFSANLGRAFRAPTFEDLYSPLRSWSASLGGPAGDTKGNQELRPESSWGYDLGMQYELGTTLLGKLTLFRSDVDDLIQWAEVDPAPEYEKWRPSNVGKSYNQGIEAEIIQRIFKDLSHSINYTYLESKGKGKGEADYETLMYTPPHRVNYQINYRNKFGSGLSLELGYTHRQQWKDDWELLHELPGYVLLNLHFSQRILGAELFLQAKNLLDKNYLTRESYPLPGRTISTGIRMKFWD